MNSLPKTVTRQRHDCDLNLGHSASESSTLTTRLPSHHRLVINLFRRFRDPTRVYTPIGISIGSSVSAGLTGVTNTHTQTDRQTGRQTDGRTDGQTDHSTSTRRVSRTFAQRLVLMSLTCRTVTFPAAGHNGPFTGTNLYCLVSEPHACK